MAENIKMADFEVMRLPECDSSNAEMQRRLAAGLQSDTVLIVTRQTQGRGRNGRTWASPEGALTFSVLLPAPRNQRLVACAGLIAALALCDTISVTHRLRATIKWPNDILIGGQKVAGILSEYVAEKNRLIVGVGVNLNCTKAVLPTDLTFPATTLRDESGKSVVVSDFLQIFLSQFRSQMQTMDVMGFASARAVIESRLAYVGELITFALSERENVQGKLVGIDEFGQLLVEMDNGTRRAFVSGDVLRPQMH